MTQPDLNNLRALLDENERYVNSIAGIAGKSEISARIQAAIAEARLLLRPSADGTANFVETRTIVERLAALRREAEASLR